MMGGGRYRVESLLGRGGMGSVYAVTDVVRGIPLAMKRLNEPASSAAAAASLHREYTLLAELKHPSIIRVFDYGQDEIGPYYTMELLSGPNLSERGRLPFREACRLLRDVASSLAVLHARRLLHRDVSLRNLHGTADQRCKLLDFGAMTRMGVVASRVGTPPYLAPEAFFGEQPLDERADLFALGAALYRLLTGKHAYPASSFEALPDCWRKPPRPPHELVPDIPSPVSQLALSLLSLDPLARPGSAAEVMERLSALSGLGLREPGEARQAFLASPRLVGRARQAQQLRFFFSQATELRPAVLAIRGAAGSGRTRMLELCVREAQRAGLSVLMAQGRDPHNAYGVLLQLLDSACASIPHARAATAELRALLSEAPAAAANGSPPTRPAARRELQSAAVSCWQALLAQQPLLLAIDDVERADEPSLACLTALHGPQAKLRPLLALTSADDRSVHARAACEFLCRDSTRIDLPSLTREQVLELLCSIFGDAPNVTALADRVHQISGGQPQWVVQLAEHLIDRGTVRYEAGVFSVPVDFRLDALPPTLGAALQARLGTASAEACELAQVLMLDPDAWYAPEELAHAADRPLAHVEGLLDELVRRGLVARDRERVGLRHGVQLTAAGWREPRTEHGHLQLAAIFERRGDRARQARQLWAAGSRAAALAVLIAYSEAAQRGLQGDPALLDRLIASMPADFVTLLCDAIAACRELGQPRRAELTLRLMCLRIAAPTCHESAGDQVRALLTHLHVASGIADWEALADVTDPAERVRRARSRAEARHAAASPHERGYSVDEALQTLPAVCAHAANVLSQTLDFELAALLQRTAAQVVLSPTLAVVRDVVEATFALIAGRYEAGLARYARVLELLDGPEGERVDPIVRRFNRLGSWYAFGYTAAQRGQAAGLEWAERLQTELLFEVPALRIRNAYHRAHGDLVEAERCRREAELLRIAQRPHEHYRLGSLGMELYQCLIAEDLLGVKRLRDELSAVASRFPGWTGLLEVARGEYARLRAQPQAALAHFEAALASSECGRDSAWQTAAASCLLALHELGRLEEASVRGHAFLQAVDRAELRDSATLIVQRLALVEAQLGHADVAVALAERALRLIEELQVCGTRAGLAHETRTRVAIALADEAAALRHLAECARHFRSGNSPALGARYERIARDARAAGMRVPPSDERVQPTAADDLAALRAQLQGCATAEQRAACVLQLLAEHAGATDGALYLAEAGRLQLRAVFGSTHWQPELQLHLEHAPEPPLTEADAEQTIALPSGHAPGESPLCLLLHELEGESVVLGAAVLRGDAPSQRVAAALLPRLCAQLLLEAGDATPLPLATPSP